MRTMGLESKGFKGFKALGFALALCAAAVAHGSAPELAGTIAVAPFTDVSAKATEFGALIGNPIVPALLLATLQQSAVTTYGRFRTDAPIHAASYEIAPGQTEEAIVYPSVDRIARMALANPGSAREGKDVLHLVPSERHPQERYAVFSDDGQFVAFAPTVDVARRALADCQPSVIGECPLVRMNLRQAGLKAVGAAATAAGGTNVLNLVSGFAQMDISVDLGVRGLVIAFRAASGTGPVKADGLKARVERELQKLVSEFAAGEVKVAPAVRVGLEGTKVVVGEIVLSQAQLKDLGQDFNALVAAQMSGSLSGDRKNKGGSVKATAKGKEQKK